jgi:branched-chain amino acid transport system substrate-binding protein
MKASRFASTMVLGALVALLAWPAGPALAQGAKPPVKIGVVNPLTGPAALYGVVAQKAAQMAADEVNAKGGLLGGRKLELVFEDDHTSPEGVVNAINKLVNHDKVDAVTGGMNSSVTIAAKEVTRDRILHFVMAAQAEDITGKGHKWLFDLNPTVAQYAQPLLDHVRIQVKPARLAMFVENTDFGRVNVQVARQALQGSGTQIAAVEFHTQQDTDFSTGLTRIKASNPDAIFVVNAAPAQMPQIWRQVRELGLNVKRFQSAGTLLPRTARDMGALADGIVTAEVWHQDLDIAGNRAFVRSFQSRFNDQPDKAAALSYSSIHILVSAMGQAGSAESEKVAQALAAHTYETIIGTAKFDAKGRNAGKMYLLEVKGGALSLIGK